MKTIRVHESDDNLTCLCGNTFAHEGFEGVRSYQLFGVYLMVCLRCGRIFDDDTLEVVGVRFAGDCRTDLIPPEELKKIHQQSTRYFQHKLKGKVFP